ncbi:MAG: M24 family metallopeptidase [Gammaproteobacteria bacterium]|nr:M24 family metallopeptidase [Gammaproteobacteria bacterium]
MDRAKEVMRQEQVDHLVLGTSDNIRYITDYRSLIIHELQEQVLALIDAQGDATIYGPHYKEPIENPDPQLTNITAACPLAGWTPMWSEPETTSQTIKNHLVRARAKIVGYDYLHPVILLRLIELLPEIKFTYIGRALFDIRRIKTQTELELMKFAARDNHEALDVAFSIARPGVTDREMIAAGLKKQMELNAELLTHVTCNCHAGVGEWFPANNRARQGEAIFIDQVYYGFAGYSSDITRTVFIDEPPAAVIAAYEKLLEVYQMVRNAAHACVNVSELDDLMNATLKKMGLAPAPYALGHGIGLRVMEPPTMVRRDLCDFDVYLRSGEIIALEPETGLEVNGEWVALKVEDCFLVEDNGLAILGREPSVEEAILAA